MKDDISPTYTYPQDWTKVLVRESGKSGARWQYLGTVVWKMQRRREDKLMMSKTNFRKNHGHSK